MPSTSADAQRPLRIALVAGEASGDQLGGGLIAKLRARFPDAEFAGIGGPLMQVQGMDCWWPAAALSVMGLFEVLRHLPRLLRLRRDLVVRLLDWRPDVFVGIDAPDFNLGVERRLKQAGIRTVHYVSPSIWAWKEGRAARIAESADRVLCLFPMEPPIYARHGVTAEFVGHPLAERFAALPDRGAARAELSVATDRRVLALLPGSRMGEIDRLSGTFLGAAARLAREDARLVVLAPMANADCRRRFERHVDVALRALGADEAEALRAALTIVDGRSHLVLRAADVVLLASGTAALEALLAERPMVVAYRVSALTAFVLRLFKVMKSRWFSLPNVLAGRELVPELIQERCTVDAIATALRSVAAPGATQEALLAEFRTIAACLRADADAASARLVAELATPPSMTREPG